MSKISKRAIVSATVACLILVGVAAAAAHYTRSAHPDTAASDHTPSAKITAQKTPGDTPPTLQSTPNPSQSTTQNNQATTPPAPNNAACKLLTAHIAQQAIGAAATYQTPADFAIAAVTGTELSACTYSTSSATIQLTERQAKNSLGASQNATAFGSEKPSGVTDVDGYGQSAYWDPATARLHILGSNNWYVITTSKNTQITAETVAKLIDVKLW
jgi:type IV secretory pathway VirB10-like protein